MEAQTKLVQELGDGNCGIRSLWRQFDKTISEESTSINSEHIRNGRNKFALALRANSSSFIEVLVKKYGGDGGIFFMCRGSHQQFSCVVVHQQMQL